MSRCRHEPIPSAAEVGARRERGDRAASRVDRARALPRRGRDDVAAPASRRHCAAIARRCSRRAWIASLGPAPLGENLEFSTVVVDRDGRLLRPYATRRGRWRLPATREGRRSALSRPADRLRGQALPLAPRRRSARGRARGVRSSSRNGRIVSGGSTITMQVARLLEPRTERTFARQAAPDRARDRSSSAR